MSIDANEETKPIAIVTGARGGIGQELTRKLRSSGHRVAAVGRDMPTLRLVDADTHIEADTCTPEGALHAIEACRAHFGRSATLLAHCVGSTLIAPLHRSPPEKIQDVLRVNLGSALLTLQAWVASMQKQGSPGAAVLVSSVVSRIGVANHEAIAAAKGGVESLVRSAAATYAPMGLRINAVAPGMTDTPMTAPMLKLDAMREGAARQYPLGGIQTGSQVAEAMVWLLSSSADRITGQVIAIDGGFSNIRPLVK